MDENTAVNQKTHAQTGACDECSQLHTQWVGGIQG